MCPGRRGDALRAGGYVCQPVAGGRGNDLVEESKNVKLDDMEVSAPVKVAQDREARGQQLVIDDACLVRGNRGRGRPVEAGNQSQGRKVGDDELGGSSIDEALNVDGLIDGCLDDVVRRGGVENVDGAAPNTNRVLSLMTGRVAR